jgi:FtsP/CotA-like multicopper oxidase with cupredoxin domain
VIQDRAFKPDGSLKYNEVFVDQFFGDFITVNGKVWPYLDVKKGKYRFRIVNGSGSRVYTLALSPPSGTLSFTVIGTELVAKAPPDGYTLMTVAVEFTCRQLRRTEPETRSCRERRGGAVPERGGRPDRSLQFR